ncbi:SHOCT domain-containing protein [Cellulosimicrobium cellulans]|uniref:SHOCT domain-containing protein n=1 Tax=Cellulosimicrobium cellulans TaxID=1710 RepID=UPI001966320D|nr:SHOCT domain-containing protein [Cellulosimicrobium cellulans]MBN0040566.1 SHOCT domain-containing protein [Cellulosimicrobium cellulans]
MSDHATRASLPDARHDEPPLPPSAALARKAADRRAILRLVANDESVDDLPRTPDGLLDPPSSVGRKIRNGVLLVLLSVGFVWLVTVNAWDHDGFFPWFWNVVWTIFPWVFLGPLWAGYARSLRRSRDDAPLYAQYHRDRKAAVRETGVVTASVTDRTESGGVAQCVVRVRHGALTTTVTRLAPVTNLLPSEVPQPGDPVVVWRLPGERVVVQARRGRTRALHDAARAAALGAVTDAPVTASPVAEPPVTASPSTVTPSAPEDAPAWGSPTPSTAAPSTTTTTTTRTTRGGAAPEATVRHDIAAALSELAGLHASGALTDDEFAAAKRMLLGGS